MSSALSRFSTDPFVPTTDDEMIVHILNEALDPQFLDGDSDEEGAECIPAKDVMTMPDWREMCRKEKAHHNAIRRKEEEAAKKHHKKRHRILRASSFRKKAASTATSTVGGTRRANLAQFERQNFKIRLLMALLAAIFLIGPMLLMVLFNRRYTALLTSSAAIIIFAFFAAWHFEKPLDMVGSTAAYAAVLLVFVGTSGSASS